MSYEDGMAALNLDMPARIPRTEYSAEFHWPLIEAVTGVSVSAASPPEERKRATLAFMDAWRYDFFWSTLIHCQPLGDLRTKMGHAEYAAEGADYSTEVTSPFATPEEVLAFDPMEAYGPCDQAAATRQFEEHYRRQVEDHPDGANMTGIYITLVSGLIEIFGWDLLLLAAGTDPDAFGALTDRYAAWIQGYYDALGAAEVPVVMVHDDIVWTSGPFIHPDWYRRFVFPNYRKFFAPLRDSGKRIMFTSDGNYTAIMEDVAGTGVHGFAIEPTTDMALMAERYGKTHVIIGNADTRILLNGTHADIRAEVKRCIDIGRDCPGFFMAVGNHIPANTPIDNALYYNQCYEELGRR